MPLGIVEVSGDRDHGFGYGVAEVFFGIRFELLQHHGRDFGGLVLFPVQHDFRFSVFAFQHFERHALGGFRDFFVHPPDEPFCGVNGVFRIGDRLPFGRNAHEPFVIFNGHDGGRSVHAFHVGNDDRFSAFHEGDAGVGGAKVNADDFGHEGWVKFSTHDYRVLTCVGQAFL